jgi:hypothetical protein
MLVSDIELCSFVVYFGYYKFSREFFILDLQVNRDDVYSYVTREGMSGFQKKILKSVERDLP